MEKMFSQAESIAEILHTGSRNRTQNDGSAASVRACAIGDSFICSIASIRSRVLLTGPVPVLSVRFETIAAQWLAQRWDDVNEIIIRRHIAGRRA